MACAVSADVVNNVLKVSYQDNFYECCSFKDDYILELDLEPFNASFPRPTRPSSIGSGVQFLNRHLSSRLFHDKESMQPLLDFLLAHKYQGQVTCFPMLRQCIIVFEL